jgi:tetratricopeptide (TPR) repeat protein
MASRLLARLDAAISRTRDPVQLACLRAERAGFLGRHGKVELAHTQLKDIQRQFADRPHVAVSGWIALAEGQIEHAARLGTAAHDRFQRAHALSAAAQLKPLQALSAAWLAHTEYVRNQRQRMADMCAEALQLAAPDHHAARWRAALTVACGYHFGGRVDLAQPWYMAARTHAMADGDDVALSALIYNQAALRTSEARLLAAFDRHCEQRAAGAVIGTESSGQFDVVAGVQSLDWLVPLLRAQLLLLEARYAEALALLDEHWPRSEPHWQARMAPGMLADRAWCLWQLGRRDEAREEAGRALECIDAPSDADDRALAHARLAQVFEALGDTATAAGHADAAQRDCATHRQEQQRQVELLETTLSSVPAA